MATECRSWDVDHNRQQHISSPTSVKNVDATIKILRISLAKRQLKNTGIVNRHLFISFFLSGELSGQAKRFESVSLCENSLSRTICKNFWKVSRLLRGRFKSLKLRGWGWCRDLSLCTWQKAKFGIIDFLTWVEGWALRRTECHHHF